MRKRIKPFYQCLMKGNREFVVLKMVLIELIVLALLSFLINWESAFFKIGGIGTFLVLLVSAPVAFVVWHFRDTNTQQQIKNQSKDVNLKEFQKIAEWVSGAHLVEDKITVKPKENTDTDNTENNEIESKQEISREYSRQPEKQNIETFSKQDGAAGLQIAAVYMLLPFYRGNHGEDFRRPAFNLLTAAWLSLFRKVEDIDEGKELAKKPLATAITEVLFAEGGLFIHSPSQKKRYSFSQKEKYKHLFVNLQLPFVNLTLPGLDKKASKVFAGKNCQKINLYGADLRGADLRGADLQQADLQKAILWKADLRGADLWEADLQGAKLSKTKLGLTEQQKKTNLTSAKLQDAEIVKTTFQDVEMKFANFQFADLKACTFSNVDMTGVNLLGAKFSLTQEGKTSLTGITLDNTKLLGALLATEDASQFPDEQRADTIVFDGRKKIDHKQIYQLTATRIETEKKIQHKIQGFIPNDEKIAESNRIGWEEIKIEKLPSDSQ